MRQLSELDTEKNISPPEEEICATSADHPLFGAGGQFIIRNN